MDHLAHWVMLRLGSVGRVCGKRWKVAFMRLRGRTVWIVGLWRCVSSPAFTRLLLFLVSTLHSRDSIGRRILSCTCNAGTDTPHATQHAPKLDHLLLRLGVKLELELRRSLHDHQLGHKRRGICLSPRSPAQPSTAQTSRLTDCHPRETTTARATTAPPPQTQTQTRTTTPPPAGRTTTVIPM